MTSRSRKLLALPFVLTAAIAPAHAEPDPAKEKLRPAPAGSNVRKDPNGRCWYQPAEDCPPNVRCNPGPPQEVECPAPPKAPSKK